MKVLFIEPCFPDFGGYFRAYNICYHLSQNNIKVDLLVSSKSKFSLQIKKTIINQNLTQYELPRIYYNFFITGRILRGIIALLWGLLLPYDIIHAAVPTQLESNIPAFFLRLFGKTVVVDWDDLWSDTYFQSPILKFYLNFCENNAPRFFKNIVTVSRYLSKKATALGATNVLKLINAVNIDEFAHHSTTHSRRHLKLDPRGKYLLTFGNSIAGDRGRRLFTTFSYIHHLDPTIKLICNFNPVDIFNYYHLDHRLLKSLIIVGQIPQSNLGYYLAAANATIFISGQGVSEVACFPIRIGSFINGKRPIIINDNKSDYSRIIKDYHLGVCHPNLKKLADLTVDYLSGPKTSNITTANFSTALKTLSWQNQIKKLIRYYECLPHKDIKK